MKPTLIISLLLNIIFLGIILWPQPKLEKEMIKRLREIQKGQNKNIAIDDAEKTFQKSEDIMREISAGWKLETVKALFSKEVYKEIGDEKMTMVLNVFKKLGKYKSICGTRRISNYPIKPDTKVVTMACEFENGKANVILVIVQKNGNCLLGGITINSDLLLQK
jgi:hypothetical protein